MEGSSLPILPIAPQMMMEYDKKCPRIMMLFYRPEVEYGRMSNLLCISLMHGPRIRLDRPHASALVSSLIFLHYFPPSSSIFLTHPSSLSFSCSPSLAPHVENVKTNQNPHQTFRIARQSFPLWVSISPAYVQMSFRLAKAPEMSQTL